FKALYQKQHAGGIYREKIAPYCDHFIFTAAEKNVEFHCPQFTASFPVKKIPTLSTVGAGDSFNAGILYGLMRSGICRKDLPLLNQSDWEKIIALGIDFSAKVCQSYENYIPWPGSSNSGVNQ
ncbi:MAG TPA: PfkB family carbohydrate kinase, partial [Bacteroidales bacterium]|nr:PfkB family carbohydrate kinase [Bacteroidales bacterium]